MRLALSLGQRGLGQVWPNPAVGCVIVQNGRVVGRGWTQPGGRPHAEVRALTQAGPQAHDATAYVTLEPCAHHGKSGPCATALVQAGISRVVSAVQDPDPRVSGQGHDILRRAGVSVCENMLHDMAEETHCGFFTKIRHARPMVTLKLASSLDGRIATQTGDSRWITGPAARRAVHLLRACHDAILVGRNTVEQDDPDLTVRDLGLSHRSPVRVVLDSQLRLPHIGKLATTARNIPLWMCHGANLANPQALETWHKIGAETLQCANTDNGQLDIRAVLGVLADRGITRVMVEGGGQIAAALMRENLVDQLVLFTAGVAIGAEGLPNLANLGLTQLAQAPRFTRKSVTAIGPDIQSVWTPLNGANNRH
jgi:diaminohydroxyphosphoribosylaminopyrimidine deaminase/5-amino-6-(5-phosphoribosylamino)uracil reductase